MTQEKVSEKEIHVKFAKSLFNLTWSFFDKKDRTKDDNDKMIGAAHASHYHWMEIGTPLEFERGEWQISRVYSVLNMPESALYHAKRCLEICQANKYGDFDIAFAYEAMARANAIARNKTESKKYIELAKKAGEQIGGKEDRDYFLSELKTVPGYEQRTF